jgi:hybrid cluster-associated redox disulfide protein
MARLATKPAKVDAFIAARRLVDEAEVDHAEADLRIHHLQKAIEDVGLERLCLGWMSGHGFPPWTPPILAYGSEALFVPAQTLPRNPEPVGEFIEPGQRAAAAVGPNRLMQPKLSEVPMPIEATQLVDDIMRRWPTTIRVFLNHRMRCIGCPIACFHTVDDACREHGVDGTVFLSDLNAAATREDDGSEPAVMEPVSVPARGPPLGGTRRL